MLALQLHIVVEASKRAKSNVTGDGPHGIFNGDTYFMHLSITHCAALIHLVSPCELLRGVQVRRR